MNCERKVGQKIEALAGPKKGVADVLILEGESEDGEPKS